MGQGPGHRLDEAGRAITGRLQRLGLPAILILAGVNFLVGLGSSSFYVDEIIGTVVAKQPFGSLLHAVGHQEISPPGWFVLQHEVGLRLGSPRSEWLMRLPSALCALGLVAVVYWLVRVLRGGRGPALMAAGAASLSPFLIEYAQRAQGYAGAALGVAVAVTAALAADAAPDRSRLQRRRLVVSLLSALAALLCNYTALLVIAPLCVWLITRRSLTTGWRWGYTVTCALVQLALVPLLVTQHHAHPRRGVGASAVLNGSTLQNMLALPFGGRVSPLRLAGVVLMLAAVAVAVVAECRRGQRGFGARRLVLGLAIGEPAALILLSATGGHFFGLLMLNRYGAVAVPFLIASLALAVAALPRGVRVVVTVAVAAVLITGTVANHRPGSYYLDARGAATYVRTHASPGDAVLEPPYPWYQIPLEYYGLAPLHPASSSAAFGALLLEHRRRIWLIAAVPAGASRSTLSALTARGLRRFGYRPLAARVFPSTAPLASVLVAPTTLSR